MRIPLIFLSPLLLVLAGATSGPEWKPLFNGKDLAGWTVKCKPVDAEKNFWRVEEGTILANSLDSKGHDYIWLMSEAEYGDFVLRLKFQTYRDSPGNSGVQIRSRYDDKAGWLDGPQIDIHPPGPWRTGMMWDETRGVQRWIFPAIPKGKWVDPSMASKELKFFYADQDPAWNDMEIRAAGTRITVTLNGVKISDYDGAGVLDDAVHRERNTGVRGHIALQIHKGDKLKIRFKDLAIQELSEAKK